MTEKGKKKGLLIVISGPAGSGKGTVTQMLKASGEYAVSVSATTRSPRPGEVNGVSYHFITHDQFRARLEEGGMLEYNEYCGHFYGTPRREAEEILSRGIHLILEIDVNGALQIKSKYPDAVLIMLLSPSFAVQEQRLRGRGTEAAEEVRQRLEQTRVELSHLPEYDYVVYNRADAADACAEDIRAIVRAEQCSLRRNPDARTAYFSS